MTDAYDAVLNAKLKRDRQSFAEFRKVDQRLHDAQRKQEIAGNLDQLRDSVREYKVSIAALEAEATGASSVFALAGQHAAEAEKYALEQRQAWELVRGDRLEDGTSPGELVEAEIRMEKADRVASARRTEAQAASLALYDAEAALEAERSELAHAEEQLGIWTVQAGRSGIAPLSEVTLRTFTSLLKSDEQTRDSLSSKDLDRADWAGVGVFNPNLLAVRLI